MQDPNLRPHMLHAKHKELIPNKTSDLSGLGCGQITKLMCVRPDHGEEEEEEERERERDNNLPHKPHQVHRQGPDEDSFHL